MLVPHQYGHLKISRGCPFYWIVLINIWRVFFFSFTICFCHCTVGARVCVWGGDSIVDYVSSVFLVHNSCKKNCYKKI